MRASQAELKEEMTGPMGLIKMSVTLLETGNRCLAKLAAFRGHQVLDIFLLFLEAIVPLRSWGGWGLGSSFGWDSESMIAAC